MELVREPLYRQIAALLKRQLISTSKAGDRIQSEAELARRFSVSTMTLRQALTELAHEGLIERRHGSGTFVASPRRGKEYVGILIEGDISAANFSPFYIKCLQTVRLKLLARGIAERPYLGFLPNLKEPAELTCPGVLEDARLGRLSGLISLHARSHSSWTDELKHLEIPVIGFGPTYDHQVVCDVEGALKKTLGELRKRGRKRLAIIGWDNWYDDRKPLQEIVSRLLPEYGFDTRFMNLRAHGSESGMGWQSFRELWTAHREKPDCLLIHDDTLFGSALQAVREIGVKIPENLDLAVHTTTTDLENHNPDLPVIKVGFGIDSIAEALVQGLKRISEKPIHSASVALVPAIMIEPALFRHSPPAEFLKTPTRAFTLFEMMITVSIIVILALMITPAVSSIREKSLAAKCASNLKQLGAAFVMYAQDNNGYLPPVKESGALNALSWYRLVGPYLGKTTTDAFGAVGKKTDYPGYMACPSVKAQEKEGYTYGVNYMGQPFNPKAPFGWYKDGLASIKLSNIRASCFLATDSHVGDLPYSYLIMSPAIFTLSSDNDGDGVNDTSAQPPGVPYGGMEPRHSNGANFLRADGSVKWLSIRQWAENEDQLWTAQ